jgi:ABC-type transport system substrate-binding protein
VVQARRDDVVELVRAAGGAAFVDGVELHLYDSADASYDAFVDGALDWTVVPPGRVDDAAGRFGVEGFVPFQAELLFGFNTGSPVFADLRFRQAIAAAVDRQAIVNAVYFGAAEPLAGMIPAGIPGHDPARCDEACGHDPERARALLAEAFPAGAVPEVVIDYDDGADEGSVTSIIEQNLEAVGIPVTRRPHPVDQYGSFVVGGDRQLFRLGWIGLYPAPDAYLAPLFASGSPDNVFGLSDPAVDAALAALATATDPGDRQRLAAAAEAAVLATGVVVPIAQFQLPSVSADRVRRLDISVSGTFDAEQVWLDR